MTVGLSVNISPGTALQSTYFLQSLLLPSQGYVTQQLVSLQMLCLMLPGHPPRTLAENIADFVFSFQLNQGKGRVGIVFSKVMFKA